MNYTPGPWKVQTFSAKTYMISTFQNGLIAQHVPGEANARLIAAAPELYEALENLLEACQLHVGIRRTPIFQAMHQATAALAKARGDEGEENA